MTIPAKQLSFKGLLEPEQRLTDPAELLTYDRDAGLEEGMPEGVLFPRSTSDLVQIVAWAQQNGVPLVARGAGTGTSGGAVAERHGVIVEFSNMNRILEFDELENRVLVEPGVVNFALDQFAQSRGLFFPPDPASGRVCTVGGNIAENAGGPRCFKYGVMTNYVTGIKAVLPDGRVARFGGRALDYPEYDWAGVLTGSEGTLGLITEANLRLLRKPAAATLLMAAFDSVEQAGDAVSHILAQGLVPATIEMMDQAIVKIVEEFSHIGLPVEAGAILIIEVNGYAASLPAQVEEIKSVLSTQGAREITLAETPEQRERIWRARKDSAGALAWLAPAYYASDCTVPRTKIAIALKEISRLCDSYHVPVNYLLHAGDGNLHPNYMVADAADRELMERVRNIEAQVLAFCVKQGGSITGEHGVGIERRDFMPLMYNSDELDVMRDVKRVFDPQELLNPGKIFPTEIAAPEPLPVPTQPLAALVAPASTEQAAEAIRACLSGESQTIGVRGGRTKSALVPPANVVLSTLNLKGIRAYVSEDSYAIAGAGTTLAELQDELKRDKMWLAAVSPWKESTLGGIVSTNFNAPLRMRYGYGAIRDWVLGVTVALPDGRVVRMGRPVVKNVAGYDLAKLFVGAHGTLGMITELIVKITTLPRARMSLAIPVDDLERGLAWGRRLKSVCLCASALLLCRGCDIAGFNSPYVLVYTAEGMLQDVTAELDEAHQALQSVGAPNATLLDGFSGSDLWATWLGSAAPVDTVLRVGVAPRHLADVALSSTAVLGDAAFVADLANGMLYLKSRVEADSLRSLRDLASPLEGYAIVLSGRADSHLDRWGYTPDGLPEMREIKSRWDPRNRFNPGAFLVPHPNPSPEAPPKVLGA